MITADLIGFTDAFTATVHEQLSARLGIDPQAVMLAASHTHSGPQTGDNMVTAGGPCDPAYMQTLLEAFVNTAVQAQQAARPAASSVTLHLSRGELQGFAINRRLIVNGKAVMAPNPDSVRDDEVTVLTFRNALDGQPIAALFHYTCHPTIMGDFRLSADYPGAARRYVERALGVTAGFLPGCFADIRSNCTLVGGQRFRRGTREDVAAFGNALGLAVMRVTPKPFRTPAFSERPVASR